jgi:hypothetical protein
MSMLRGSMFPFVLVVLSGACDSSDDEPLACTDVGCSDGVHVVVRPAGEGWRAGDYTVRITAGKDSSTCTATLPNASEWELETTTFECEDAPGRLVYLHATGCDGDGDRDGDGDGGTDGVSCGSLQLQIPGTPSSVRVRIDRSGESLLDESWRPKYREFQPNGPGCEPICKQSSLEGTLSE